MVSLGKLTASGTESTGKKRRRSDWDGVGTGWRGGDRLGGPGGGEI